MVIFTDFKNAVMPADKIVIECINKYKPKSIFLREKDADDKEYMALAKKIIPICMQNNVELFICHRYQIAKELGVKNFHTNINNLSKIYSKNCFDKISVSIHNEKEVKIAEKLFATNLVFGHIFETDCKVGLTPRGLKQLEKICDIATIPVMAIGGINSNNYKLVLQNGAIDFAIMSSAMKLTF